MKEGYASENTQGRSAKAGVSGWVGGTLERLDGSWSRANKGQE